MTNREKIPLIIGIALPLLLIAYVALTNYLPSLYAKPQYNFIYASGYYSDYDFPVVNGRLTVQPRYPYPAPTYPPPYPPRYQPTLYLYDVKAEKSTQITLEQAQTYTIDPSDKSPDGFLVGAINRGESYGIFPLFFGGDYDSSVYLHGKGLRRKISEQNYYSIRFIGWVLDGH